MSCVPASGAPLVILQGSDDPIVPPNQAHMIRHALKARGVPRRRATATSSCGLWSLAPSSGSTLWHRLPDDASIAAVTAPAAEIRVHRRVEAIGTYTKPCA